MVVIAIVARVSPSDAPAGDRYSWPQRLQALVETWPVMLIFAVVIGGIYGGFFTPTEAASIGTVATAFVAWRSGGLRGKGFLQCMYGTAAATGMIFLILLGADVLNVFLVLTQVNVALADWVIGLHVSPILVMFVIIFIYLVLGCIMDSLSMILLTIPIFFPIVMGLDLWGLDPVQGHLVRHHRADGGRDRADYPGGHERVHHQQHGQRRAHEGNLQVRHALLASDLLRIVLIVFVPSIVLFVLKI